MRYESAVAFRSALETRLKAEQSTGVGLSRLRNRVVFERLVARLLTVAPDAWILKGGFALEMRLGGRARSTRDVDLDWLVASADVGRVLREADDGAGPKRSSNTSPRSCTPTRARMRGVSPARE